ncbi:cytochrome b5-like heme/steroid binding domain-containing protein [Exophiala viscosa]|uniref:Cytochrome b5-like heme/steroid binding domain-containing protein n=1 Tax=Exophiala viscosa TaxID=2486360 RepID=A0AAN6E2A3_9EURO|nr:cytochrome b5-like heme/steroid binding domain-containing protein [Exophiala viscosa]KAI1630466.1 cytochrome b5-like heme/steroid binding domain-containing protein [Exophiala viscosa]
MWRDTQKDFLCDTSSPVLENTEGAEALYPVLRRTLLDKDLPAVPASEVSQRTGLDGQRLWLVVDQIVYDCTDFVGKHPGGSHIIREFGGHDCTWQWWTFHTKSIYDQYMPAMRVGKTSNVTNKYEQPQRRIFQLRTIGEQW